MRARQLIIDASYKPDRVKVLLEALDGAWNSIAGNLGDEPQVVETARIKLAHIIVNLPDSSQIGSVEAIKNAALQAMALSYRERSM